MVGVKPSFLDYMHYLDLKGIEPQLKYLLEVIYNVLEDVHEVSSMSELQETVDSIGTGAGTIFIKSGTHIVDTPIDIDGGGSLVIYGHGDNTILEAVDGVNVFNITDCASLIIKTLRIDATAYTGATSSVIIDEVNDNVVVFEDVSIIGNNFGCGIELISNNCMIEHCNISQLQDGIYLNNSNRNIITQNLVQNNARYGINLNTVLYSNIGNNISNSNLMGIYVNNSTNNSISNNICNLNTENGIYITNSSYNTISGNTCENNDSNTANDQAGLYITNNSSFNTISGNSLNNNNNLGLGDAFGFLIATATCIENVVASNNWNGNDIDVKDAGTLTVIRYYVQSGDELQDAIDSIGTGAGTVIITNGVLSITATINILGGGDYVITGEGVGSVLETVGDISCFNITSAKSCVLKDFKIDASSLTTNTTKVVLINEGSDNKVKVDNLTIVGDGINGYGVYISSDNCIIERCWIQNIRNGIYLDAVSYCKVKENTCYSNNYHGIYLSESTYNTVKDNISYDNARDGIHAITSLNAITGNVCYNNFVGIQLKTTANHNTVSGNTCYNNSKEGIYINTAHNNSITGNTCSKNGTCGIWLYNSDNNAVSGNVCNDNDLDDANVFAGIYISGDSDNNTINGNTCNNNNNIGVGTGHGVHISDNTCNNNVVLGNSLFGNDVNCLDSGTDSDFEYRCFTAKDIQDAINSIATKSGTITIISGTITLSATLNVNGGGSYIIEGYGDKTIIDVGGDWKAFNITSATSCILRNFKIDATDLTTNITRVIDVSEGSDNKVIVDNIKIIGDNTNGYGVYISSDNVIVQNCWVEKVRNGIMVSGGNYCKIVHNTFYDNNYHGISLSGGDFCTVSDNHSFDNTRDGVYLGDTSLQNVISGNYIHNNYVGIHLFTGSNINNVVGNMSYDNVEEGIYVNACHNNVFSGNICNANGTCGIWLNASSNNTITGNVCNNNDIDDGNNFGGIYISGNSDFNTISGNTCNNNNNIGLGSGHGIHIVDNTGNDNTVMGNTALENDTNYTNSGTNTFDSAGGNPLNNFVAGAG